MRMATPGRTHISWQTDSGQINELINYVAYLEAKVQFLERHHEHCHVWTAHPDVSIEESPYLPPEVVVDAEERQVTHLQRDSHKTPNVGKKAYLRAPIYKRWPQPKPTERNPRWRQIIDHMMEGWREPGSWRAKRVNLGLGNVEHNGLALTLLLRLNKSSPNIGNGEGTKEARLQSTSTDPLVHLARQYALDTKPSDTGSDFTIQMHIFRKLIFASLCVVMEHQQLPIETVNELMRICMSSSGSANLYRLRRGALWINQVIADLFGRGWNRQATEFFLLSGCPVSQYGLLWEACEHSFPYLRERLAKVKEVVEIPEDEPNWMPFSIPLLIKGVVGDALNLEDICTALDYDMNML